jgi:hypothetical protein
MAQLKMNVLAKLVGACRFIESLNGRLRDELLSETLFSSVPRQACSNGGSITMAAGITHSSTGERQTSLHQPSHRDGHWRCAKMESSAPQPAVSTADKRKTNAGTNSRLDKAWGQGQWRL